MRGPHTWLVAGHQHRARSAQHLRRVHTAPDRRCHPLLRIFVHHDQAAALLDWDLERVCGSVFAPVGLDLGGEGAEAIALAVIAQIQACCEGRAGAVQAFSARLTAESVAELVAQGGASLYLQAQCAL